MQARSTASVDAMLEATLQVLLQVGKERLTTTRVAERAGVSVGTLYQYFPNKSSLLKATLRRHLTEVGDAVAEGCRSLQGRTLVQMGEALAEIFLTAKMKDGRASVALYAIAADVEGMEIAQEMRQRTHTALCALLATASDGPVHNPELVSTMCVGILGGLSRQLLESENPQELLPGYRQELRTAVGAYLAGCRR